MKERGGHRGAPAAPRAAVGSSLARAAGLALAAAAVAGCAGAIPDACGTAAFAVAASPSALGAAAPARAQVPRFRLRLNIPAYRPEAYEGTRLVRTFPVAVGMRRYPTPRGGFAVTRVVWNPWWTPPERAWAARERVTPPGPRNPMGRVKLYFSPYYFLHGTPSEASIGSAASHGCVRMRNEDAIALARLVHAHASGDVSAAELDSLEALPRATRTIELAEPVPLEVVYETAEVRGDTVAVLPDVYGRGTGVEDLVQVLVRAGYDAPRIEIDSVRGLLRRGRDSVVAVPIGALLAPPAPSAPGRPQPPGARQ